MTAQEGSDLLAEATQRTEDACVETGVPNFDTILGGGLPRAGLALIIGAPGSGKTTLAQQIAFHRAERGDRTLFLTGYSETHDKLVRLGQSLTFFDAARIGTAIHFGSLPDLLRDGVEQAEQAILATARRLGCRLVILDGYRSLGPLIGDAAVQAGVRLLYNLGTKLGLLGATTLVLMEGDARDLAPPAELGVADVLIALHSETRSGRERRLLHIRKRRGARPLSGYHPYDLERSGIHVWPRFESWVQPVEPTWQPGRAGFQTPPIDALLHGGLTRGTVTLAAGSFGTGKTLLGLHFAAEGARLGEPTLVLGFMESAAQLRAKGEVFALGLERYERSGALKLVTLPAHDLEADCVGQLLHREIAGRGVRRLVIDSAGQLERSIVDVERRADFFAALVSYLRGRAVTTLLPYEIAHGRADVNLADSPLAVLAENLLLLRAGDWDGQLRRLLSIMHMRFSEHDHRPHAYTIEAGTGIRLLDVVLPEPAAVGPAGGPHTSGPTMGGGGPV